MPSGSALGAGEPLGETRGVVAHRPDERRERRQAGGDVHPARGDEVAQLGQRRPGARHERVAVRPPVAVDLALLADRAPDEIGVDAKERVAPAYLPALDRFEKERAAVGRPEL